MSYARFGLMILTSTVVMFVLMYLNTYAWEHLFFSETRAYMALLMGASMAIIMLAYMLGMYSSRRLNIAIFIGAALAFAGSLWLVRSQETVSGPSYMRAMIPHHSIAVMTSERAQIRDPRVRKLADEIIAAQRKEIAEMRWLIAQVSAGDAAEDIYRDPPPQVGDVEAAMSNLLRAPLDLATLPPTQAGQALDPGPRCLFRRSPESDPILHAASGGRAGAVKLSGVIIPLEAASEIGPDGAALSAPGIEVTVSPLGEEAGWRSNAELVFRLEEGPRAGYRGFYDCEG
jgi:hypothetical protein